MSPDDATPDVPEDVPAEAAAPEADAGETKISKVSEAPEADAGETKVSEVPAEAATEDAAPDATEEAAEAPAEKPKPKRTRKPKVTAETSVDADAESSEEPAAEGEAEAETEQAEAEETPKPARRRRAAATKEPEEAPAPKAAPKRAHQTSRRAVVRAQAKYVRTSARKARMVCGHIRGKSVDEARAILAFTPRDVARDWSKLLESAVANAENNHELVGDDLIVHEVYADEGPTIKRFRPRGKGRATPIRKRTSHLTITLTPRS